MSIHVQELTDSPLEVIDLLHWDIGRWWTRNSLLSTPHLIAQKGDLRVSQYLPSGNCHPKVQVVITPLVRMNILPPKSQISLCFSSSWGRGRCICPVDTRYNTTAHPFHKPWTLTLVPAGCLVHMDRGPDRRIIPGQQL